MRSSSWRRTATRRASGDRPILRRHVTATPRTCAGWWGEGVGAYARRGAARRRGGAAAGRSACASSGSGTKLATCERYMQMRSQLVLSTWGTSSSSFPTSISRSIASASELCFTKNGTSCSRISGASSSAEGGFSSEPWALSAFASRSLYSVPSSPARWRTYSCPHEPRSSWRGGAQAGNGGREPRALVARGGRPGRGGGSSRRLWRDAACEPSSLYESDSRVPSSDIVIASRESTSARSVFVSSSAASAYVSLRAA